MVTREDVERAAWAASGWSVEQPVVDELMAAVDAYVKERVDAAEADLAASAVVDLDLLVAVPASAVELEPQPQPGVADTVTGPVTPGPDEKTCTRCGAVKPLVDFGRDKTTRSGYKARCRVCLAEVKREWQARQPGRAQSRR